MVDLLFATFPYEALWPASDFAILPLLGSQAWLMNMSLETGISLTLSEIKYVSPLPLNVLRRRASCIRRYLAALN
jgi:hypothetical protein